MTVLIFIFIPCIIRLNEIEARLFMLNHFRLVARMQPESRKPDGVAESAYPAEPSASICGSNWV